MQVEHHPESRLRQYQLTNRAKTFGWAAQRCLVIDDDLGISGAQSSNRPGYQWLVSMLALREVGIVFGLEEPLPGRQIGDVRAPQGIWPDGAELPLDQIIAGLSLLVASGRPYTSTPTHTAQLSDAHQPRDTLAAAVHTMLVCKLGMDAWDAVRATAPRMDVLDRGGQRGIGDGARRRRPLQPGVVARLDTPRRRHMKPIGNEVFSASMNRKISVTDPDRRRWRRRPPLFSTGHAPCATSGFRSRQPAQFLALGGGQSVLAFASVEVALAQPVAQSLV